MTACDRSCGNRRRWHAPYAILVAAALAGCTTADALDVQGPAISFTTPARYAAIVVDANDGHVLYSSNADDRRYPASLTKMMTLYLLFQAMAAGRVQPTTLIPVSAHAASEPPTRIGFRPGETIDVDSAIKAIVTRSANDVAVAIGEYLGGTEENFAAMMTAKAHALGMSGTRFANASGLPDPDQWTTARDMALLGLALRQNFPQYYHYFSVEQFTFRGHLIRGHNKVLDRVAGADGIKTGYTRASGYNIASSVKENGRSLVAVIMGEDSVRMRREHIAALLDAYLPRASVK
jgi:D-alanyl-D-alanine carboxypeptidase